MRVNWLARALAVTGLSAVCAVAAHEGPAAAGAGRPLLFALAGAAVGVWRRERWTRPQVLAHQARALESLRAHAYTRSPFYQRFHAGRMDQPLQDLPVLSKSMLMEHFDELATTRLGRVRAAH